MIYNISWASYIYAIVCLSFVYYGIAGSYYRQEIKAFIFHRRIAVATISLPALAETLINEVGAYCIEASSQNIPKIAILNSLKGLLQKYAGLKGCPYTKEINKRIGIELEKRCSILLDASELEMLWID